MSTKVVHRFIRSANLDSNIHNRIANRFNPFSNTLVTLNDPATDRTLYLIGTTNASTTLAHRTRLLLEKVRPEAVYVQTSQDWWNYAQHVNVPTQQLFTLASKDFPERSFKFQNHLRGLLFRLRYLSWRYFFESSLQLTSDFPLLTPGLETQLTLKYATENNAQKIFGGHTFDIPTLQGLRQEPDLYFHTYLWKGLRNMTKLASSWTTQTDDFFNTLHVRGGQAFAESIDRSRINFLVALLSKAAPHQKRILVDQRDKRIFRDINKIQGKNIVAVVNQWHMEGVETHWRRYTKTEEKKQIPSPIADMDIDAVQQNELVNDWLRDYVSGVTKSEPATWQNYLTNYHKQNFEYERTRHVDHHSHQDIPEPGAPKNSHH